VHRLHAGPQGAGGIRFDSGGPDWENMTTPPTKPPFRDEQMRAWIRGTDAGAHFLQGLRESQCHNCNRLREQGVECCECDKRQKVLVVCGVTPEGKAWVEVYCDDRVDAHVCQVLTVPAAGEIAAEELAELRMPRAYAELYLPVRRRKTHTLLPRTPQDEAALQAELTCLKELATILKKSG